MKSVVILLLGLGFSQVVWPDVPEQQKSEVDHLLSYVRESACLLIRNDKNYDAEEAAAHIKRKYRYFKNEIDSTEEFIEYSATKSTMSGKYYLVKCGSSQPLRTADWLLAELRRYRKKDL